MSVVKTEKDGRVIASKTTSQERMNICQNCPHMRTKPWMYCARCGCALSWKTKLKSGACPIGKW